MPHEEEVAVLQTFSFVAAVDRAVVVVVVVVVVDVVAVIPTIVHVDFDIAVTVLV